ncbi:MAG: methyltransferase domain-containing protein [Geobacteraceae bacterium]|nr:methyltransferase domain-containing protein [Geobacteraceae bacterium]
MNYVETFNPAILLGDRLGLTLYGMFVESYLNGNYQVEKELYNQFIRHFPAERKEHTPNNFIQLIESVIRNGLDPFRPVYANPDEYSLVQGSHRCSIAIVLGIKNVTFNLRFTDDRTDERIFKKIFSAQQIELLHKKRDEFIDRCDPDTAFRCRVRILMRQGGKSFNAPFSSKSKIPTLRTYQGLESLYIKGKRPSAKRLEIYEICKYLHQDMNGLEIGCNVGFFTLTLAPYLKRIDAFDIDANYIALATLAQVHSGITNASFFVQSLKGYVPDFKYDLVVSTAVHGWSGLRFSNYLALLCECMKPGGILLFESHEIDAENDWNDKRSVLLDTFELLESGLIDDVDKSMYASEMREFLVLKKPSTSVDKGRI